MYDRLELVGLTVDCIIGDLPEEREYEQRLILDLAVYLDLSVVAASDQVADTLDYVRLAAAVRACLQREKCRMIERAAECVATLCLADQRVQRVRVKVLKSGRVAGLAGAAVIIRRKRRLEVAKD